MINVELKLHDKFSIEIKSGISISTPDNADENTNKDGDKNEFSINTWVFLPPSINMNRNTYVKDDFYKDVKTNLRLITPIYSLKDIITEGKGPFARLDKALVELKKNPSDAVLKEHFQYQIKMLMCILQSALRREISLLTVFKDTTGLESYIDNYISTLQHIISRYRGIPLDESLDKESLAFYRVGDEYLSIIVADYAYEASELLNKANAEETAIQKMNTLIASEHSYKEQQGFLDIKENDDANNSEYVTQKSLLKKVIESDLFLAIQRKADGTFMRRIYYDIAAGVAMIFATAVSFFATLRYGSFTWSLFIALVISYIFKDRIKEIMRFYFSSNMSKKYFDTKLNLSIRQKEIGVVKEAFDFTSFNKVPGNVLSLRRKMTFVPAEKYNFGEEVYLYRKHVSLSHKELQRYKEYKLTGINDITRFNFSSYVLKMDNPVVPLQLLNDENIYRIIDVNKVYPFYFVMSCTSMNSSIEKAFRILINRTGIVDIEELN